MTRTICEYISKGEKPGLWPGGRDERKEEALLVTSCIDVIATSRFIIQKAIFKF
jgi:hypothetical protein